MYKYLGIVEIQDNFGEYHVYEVFQTDTHLIYGTSCNIGFKEHGRMSINHKFTIDENLQHLMGEQ